MGDGMATQMARRRPRTSSRSLRACVERLEDRFGATGLWGMAGLEATALVGTAGAAVAAPRYPRTCRLEATALVGTAGAAWSAAWAAASQRSVRVEVEIPAEAARGMPPAAGRPPLAVLAGLAGPGAEPAPDGMPARASQPVEPGPPISIAPAEWSLADDLGLGFDAVARPRSLAAASPREATGSGGTATAAETAAVSAPPGQEGSASAASSPPVSGLLRSSWPPAASPPAGSMPADAAAVASASGSTTASLAAVPDEPSPAALDAFFADPQFTLPTDATGETLPFVDDAAVLLVDDGTVAPPDDKTPADDVPLEPVDDDFGITDVGDRDAVPEATGNVGLNAQTVSSSTDQQAGSLREGVTPTAPVVRAGLVPGLVAGNGLGVAGGAFRISRAPADGPALAVPYTLTTFGARESAVHREGVARIAAGTADSIIPIEASGSGHVFTLAVQDRAGYQVAERGATWIPAQGGSDQALLQAYRQGQSAEAFAALVERYRASVFRIGYRLLGSCQDAEDVTQMVFLVLAQKQIKLQSTLAGWLRTVARNAAVMVLRARKRRARHERGAAQPDLEPGDEFDEELREELDAALERVPPRLQEAVRLRYLEGRSQQEAATLVGCPRGTLAQRAARGIRHLRDIVRERGNLV
jgi:RNA polymerase sigma factor (sigma-70 family)